MMAVECKLMFQVPSSIHQPHLPSLLPFPNPFLYVTDISFLPQNAFLHALFSCGTSCFAFRPTACTHSFSSFINTPVLLIWPNHVVTVRGTQDEVWGIVSKLENVIWQVTYVIVLVVLSEDR